MPEMTFKVSLEEFGKKAAEYTLDEITYNDLTIRQWVEKIASGEFAEQRHGRWIPVEFDGYADGAPVWDKFECSECGHEHDGEEDTLTDYCPDCGAKMGGADNG